MIRFEVLMIAFPIYVYFHGPFFFFFILMGLVLTICDPFLSSSTITCPSILALLPTCSHGVTVFHHIHIMTCPSSRIVSYCLRLTHITADKWHRITFRTYHEQAHVDQSSVFHLSYQETHRVRSDFLLALKLHPSLLLTSNPRYRTEPSHALVSKTRSLFLLSYLSSQLRIP